MKRLTYTLALLLSGSSFAQCDIDVPEYVIDLSNNPDTTWVLFEEDALNRNGHCCGATGNENCIRFEITLNENAAGVYFNYDGAPAFGSLDWQLDCGPENNLRDTICVNGTGPHTLTFCKSGTDNGNYSLVSVPKPTFPDDQTVPLNCVKPVKVLGVTANSVTWESISPGAPGDYNYLMDCIDCLEPTFTPDPNAPREIEFRVCGYPLLDYCVGDLTFCDTVKFTVLDSLLLDVSPLNPAFCVGGDVTLTASATGGDGVYNFLWYDAALNVVGTGENLTVDTPGTYTVEVRDGNFEPGFCDDFFKSVTVVETNLPTVEAGASQVLCADTPQAELSGSVEYATGGIWSGGNGFYDPSNTELGFTYTPTAAEIANGSVILTLTTTGAGSGCPNVSDDIELFFADTIQSSLSDMSFNCFSSVETIDPNITGGIAPYEYAWSNGAITETTDFGIGTHCLSIVDANGCTLDQCFTISAPDQLLVAMSSTPITIDGGNDGTATATPSGGMAPYSYDWSNGGNTQTISGLDYGIYVVTVTDANGCTQVGSVVVNEPRCDGFYVTTSASPVSCFGENTGSATAITVNGTGPFNYSWNDASNQSTDVALNLPNGVYEVVVTDNNGCVATNTASVTEPTQLLNTMTQTDVSVQGGNDGSALANVSGGTAGYSYAWSNAESTADISNLTAGWYVLEITDDNGCTLEDSVYINEPPCDEFNAFVGTVSPLCNGLATGEANLTLVNGVGPYSIEWSTGEIDVMDINSTLAGLYYVEVTDSRGCYTFQSFGISEPSPLVIGLNATPSTCNGADNGTIDMSIVGGTFPYYYYDWSTGATTEDIIYLTPGNYSVTVTDENGCVAMNNTTLVDPQPLDLTYDVTNVTCYGGTDGSINVSPTGGTQPYNFDWSNGASSEDLTGIDVGGYILSFSDANNCNYSQPITISVNEPEIVSAMDITIDCPAPGSNMANVTVAPQGGSNGYSVSFDGGVTFQTEGEFDMMLPTGAEYDIVISDINDCHSIADHIIINPTIVIDAIDFDKCYINNEVDETIDVTVSGGTNNYTISTDNGLSFGSLNELSIDVPINNAYQVVAQDENGCYSEAVSILLPDLFENSTVITSDFNGEDISCFGLSDGSAGSTTTGGTEPYSYTWSNSETTSSIDNLNAGTYTVLIEDAEGCQLNGSVTLVNPPLLNSIATVTSDYNGEDISCYGLSDGEATVTPTGGVAPYSYDWSNGLNTATISGLSVGQYTVEVEDANGCITNNFVNLSQPDTLNVTSSVVNVSCNGGNDGSIDATVTGGVSPYQYQWNHGPTSEDVSGLYAGSYSIMATDNNGCQYLLGEIVVDPTAIVLSVEPQDVSCYEFTDGSLDLTVAGGTLPYTFAWSNGADSEDITGLGNGSYNVVVTDGNGCYTDITGVVGQPDSLEIEDVIVDASCFEETDGMIDITVFGGTKPYAYDWSNQVDSEDNQGLTAGSYIVTVTDDNGCQQVGYYTVNEPDLLVVELSAPVNFHDHEISFAGGDDGSINSNVTGGTAPYNYQWSNGSQASSMSGLTAGVYQVLVVDELGCEASAEILLRDPLDLEMPTAFSPNNDGDNDVFDIHGIEAYPDNTLIVTNRWGNVVYKENGYLNTWQGTTQDGLALPDGVYFVILEINGGEITLDNYLHIKRH